MIGKRIGIASEEKIGIKLGMRFIERTASNIMFRSILAAIMGLTLVSCGPEASGERPQPLAFTARTPGPRLVERNSTVPVNFESFNPEQIRVGLLLPLTGPSEGTGKALRDAASIALFENYDPRIELFPIDTRGTPAGALSAARQAIEANVQIVLGPLFSESIESAAPLLREAGIRTIGFSNNRSVAGDGVYLLSFMVKDEIEQVVAYAVEQGYSDFGALIPESLYGEQVITSFSNAVDDAGAEITAIEVYPRETQSVFDPVRRIANYDDRRRAYLDEVGFLERLGDDLAAEILKTLEASETIGEPGFSAVLVPEGGELLRSLAPLLPFYEVDPLKVRFLGTGLWDDLSLSHEPSLVGGWFAGASPDKIDAFRTNFVGHFGYSPPRIATLAYDAMALVASLARYEIKRDRFSREAFEDPNGFMGVDGLFRFSKDGTTERGLAIIEIQADGFLIISEAPQSFER